MSIRNQRFLELRFNFISHVEVQKLYISSSERSGPRVVSSRDSRATRAISHDIPPQEELARRLVVTWT